MIVGSYHVRHDLTPSATAEGLLLLRSAPAASGIELLERARARGLELGRRASLEKVLASLRDLGLANATSRSGGVLISLTALGAELAAVAARDGLLFAELVHLRYQSLWSLERGGPAFAWSYRTVAELLWESAPVAVDVDRLVATVLAEAERCFAARSISFSASSVLGIMHWLRALSPPCVVDGRFSRRVGCSPESLVLALEGERATMGQAHDAPLRLEATVRTRICRTLLIDEGAFDDVLFQAEESLGVVRLRGDRGDGVILGCPFVHGLTTEAA